MTCWTVVEFPLFNARLVAQICSIIRDQKLATYVVQSLLRTDVPNIASMRCIISL